MVVTTDHQQLIKDAGFKINSNDFLGGHFPNNRIKLNTSWKELFHFIRALPYSLYDEH